MSLFKLQHADERTEIHTQSKADRFSFFTLRLLGIEVFFQKAACNNYNNIKNNAPPLYKRSRAHFSPLNPSGYFVEIPNLTLKLFTVLTQCICLFCTDLRTTANIFHYSSCWMAFITETEYLLSGKNWIFNFKSG